MGTVIDTLTVVLELDKTNFTKGWSEIEDRVGKGKKNVQQQFKGMDEATKKSTEAFSNLTKQALGFFAALVGARGVSQFVEQITQANVALGAMSTMLDMSPKRLAAWGTVFEEAGGKVEDASNALEKINQQFAKWKITGQFDPEFARFANLGKVKFNRDDSPEVAMKKVAEGLKNIYASKDKYYGGAAGLDLFRNMFGLSPEAAQLMATKGAAGMQELLGKAQKWGPSDEDVKNSQELMKAWVDASKAATAFGRTILTAVTPGLVATLHFTEKLLDILQTAHDKYAAELKSAEEHIKKGDYDPSQTSGVDVRNPLLYYLKKWGVVGSDVKTGYPDIDNPATSGGGGKGGEIMHDGAPVTTNNPLPVVPIVPGAATGGDGGGGLWDSFTSSIRSGVKNMIGGAAVVKASYDAADSPAPQAGGFSKHLAGGVTGFGDGGDMPLSTSLQQDRARYAAELRNNPALRDKILRIAANEQGGNPRGTAQVIESMMNRASVRGTSLAEQAKWFGEGGYYEQGNMGRNMTATQRAMIDANLDKALAGSNLSNYATDNASQGLAMRDEATGKFITTAQSREGAHTGQPGVETFFGPGTARSAREQARWRAWRKALQDQNSQPSYGSGDPTAAAHQAMLSSGSVSMSNSSATYNIGDVNIHTPATDGAGVANDFKEHIASMSMATASNYGAA